MQKIAGLAVNVHAAKAIATAVKEQLWCPEWLYTDPEVVGRIHRDTTLAQWRIWPPEIEPILVDTSLGPPERVSVRRIRAK